MTNYEDFVTEKLNRETRVRSIAGKYIRQFAYHPYEYLDCDVEECSNSNKRPLNDLVCNLVQPVFPAHLSRREIEQTIESNTVFI